MKKGLDETKRVLEKAVFHIIMTHTQSRGRHLHVTHENYEAKVNGTVTLTWNEEDQTVKIFSIRI